MNVEKLESNNRIHTTIKITIINNYFWGFYSFY